MGAENLVLGEAGKYRVASELLIRGFRVAFPAVDDGVDLYTENGLSIQVKTAHIQKKLNRYTFSFKAWKVISKGMRTQHFQYLDDRVTHIVLWCVDDNDFFIIPTNEIEPPYQIHYNPNPKHQRLGPSKWRGYLNRWDLLTNKTES